MPAKKVASKRPAKVPDIRGKMTQNEFSKFCGVTGSTVVTWREQGLPSLGGGSKGNGKALVTIDVREGIEWLATRMREARSRNNKDRADKERADKLARENQAARGELLDKTQVANVFIRACVELNGAHDGLPGRICGDLARQDDPAVIRRMLKNDLAGIRNAYANRLRELVKFDADYFGRGVATDDTGSGDG